MSKFYCICGSSCNHYKKCKSKSEVMRPCGRSNPNMGDSMPNAHRKQTKTKEVNK